MRLMCVNSMVAGFNIVGSMNTYAQNLRLLAAAITCSAFIPLLSPARAETPPEFAAAMKSSKGAGVVSSGTVLPPIPAATGNRKAPVASWGKPLPYPIVIADRRNNRLIEIAPDKRIVWEFPSPNLSVYSGNEDVNFSEDGKQLAVSEEDNYDVHIVDYEKREMTWIYGTPDKAGSGPNELNYPDDAHLLSDGKFLTADIRNCRVLIIDPKTQKIDTQWGKKGSCKHDPPHSLGFPNGATPMANGDILVSEIQGSWLTRMTRDGKVVWSVQAPGIRYVSDAFPTVDGKNVIVADFWKPGRVVIFDPATKKVLWQYDVKEAGEAMLDHPSIARELPGTGDVLICDDLRHRVIVVDRNTKKIIWQYGVTDQPGHAPGYLFYPDGFDLDVYRDWRPAGSRAPAKTALN
jgi:outer membrane protein assembly factor BamB